MIFRFDPSVNGGRPYLESSVLDKPVDTTLRVTVYAVDGPTAKDTTVMEVKTFPSDKPFKVEIPDRGKGREVVGVLVQYESDSTKAAPIKDFRALSLTTGKVIDDMGNPNWKTPKDLRQYWDRSLKELKKYPFGVTVIPAPKRNSSTGNCYQILINSYGNVTVSAWYFVPKSGDRLAGVTTDKKFPAVLSMPGYGGGINPVDLTAQGYASLALSPRGMGESSTWWNRPPNYHLNNLDNREKTYYRQGYLDGVRGIDFLVSRPEIDDSRLCTEGGSQGGAYAVAVAAIDQRVDVCATHVPSLSNFPDFGLIGRAGTSTSWLPAMQDKKKGKANSRTMQYLDTGNLATLLKIPTYVTVGNLDMVCPALNGIVIKNRAARNGVPTGITFGPMAGHTVTTEMRKAARDFMAEYLKPIPENISK